MNFRASSLGLGIIVVANAFALAGVARNRAGDPESQLALTQREVRVINPYSRSENSGVTLRLQWCVGDSSSANVEYVPEMVAERGCFNRSPAWLREDKLRELGFDVSMAPLDSGAREYYSHQQGRPAFVVLELGGPWPERVLAANRAALAEWEALAAQRPDSGSLQRNVASLRRRINWIEREMTRLYMIDAGANLDALRAKYPDRSRYAILRGTVRLRRWAAVMDSAWIGGEIGHISGETMNVPAPYQERLTGKNFGLTIGFGKRLEPYIVNVK
jgi:hypothetical protein